MVPFAAPPPLPPSPASLNTYQASAQRVEPDPVDWIVLQLAQDRHVFEYIQALRPLPLIVLLYHFLADQYVTL